MITDKNFYNLKGSSTTLIIIKNYFLLILNSELDKKLTYFNHFFY